MNIHNKLGVYAGTDYAHILIHINDHLREFFDYLLGTGKEVSTATQYRGHVSAMLKHGDIRDDTEWARVQIRYSAASLPIRKAARTAYLKFLGFDIATPLHGRRPPMEDRLRKREDERVHKEVLKEARATVRGTGINVEIDEQGEIIEAELHGSVKTKILNRIQRYVQQYMELYELGHVDVDVVELVTDFRDKQLEEVLRVVQERRARLAEISNANLARRKPPVVSELDSLMDRLQDSMRSKLSTAGRVENAVDDDEPLVE